MGSKILKLLLSSWNSFVFQVFDFEDYIYLCISSYLIYPNTNDEKWQEEMLNVPTITKYPLYCNYRSCKILFENLGV